jgi:orotate phosphoribosyltransferase
MDAFEKQQLAKKVHSACYITGTFLLRSGRRSTEYFDKYQLSSKPELLYEITKYMSALIPKGIEVVAGLEMGAIPVVTMISHHSGLPAAFVRKKAKEHGTARLAEGPLISGKKLLVVEDVVTSGGQVVMSADALRSLGAEVRHCLIIIDRDEGARKALATSGIELISRLCRSDFEQR